MFRLHFYRATHVVLAWYCYRKVVRPSVCLSGTLMYHGHIGWTTSILMTWIISLGSSLLGATTSATLVLSCPVSEILQVFCWEERPHHYFTRILGVFPLDEIADVALRCEDPKLIIRVITFELTQHIRRRHINVTDGWTDRQTDGRLTIAIPRFALRTSRGKN